MSYETNLKISDIVRDIENNKYVMPAIQREFCWGYEKIQNLFDSLMQGYPIGAFLFWQIDKKQLCHYGFYEFLKNYHEKDSIHNKKADLKGSDGVIAVLDGQQRLTSLYIGLKGKYAYKLKYKSSTNKDSYPERKLYLNIVNYSKDENTTNIYDFRFLEPNKIKNNKEEYWFEIGQILNMTFPETSKFVNKNISYSKENAYTETQSEFALDTISRLWEVIHKEGYITHYRETSEDLDKVLNIFIRVNNGGLELSYSDLLLSIASAQWEKYDAREEITNFVEDINRIGNGFNVSKDFVLKSSLVLSDSPDIAFKINNFKKDKTKSIEENWSLIKNAIRQSFWLVSSFGFSKDNLKANNALIPIAYYLKTIQTPDNFIEASKYEENRNLIKKWLIHSILKKAFSGQPDNVLKPIRDILEKNGNNKFPFNEIVDKFKGSNKTIIFSEDDIDAILNQYEYKNSDTKNVLMLLYPSLDYRNIFHLDHIYPKSKFTKKYLRSNGVPEELLDEYISEVNSICNLQLLEAVPNQEKSDKDFEEWFKQKYENEREKTDYRNKHYLPDLEYSYGNFLEFIKQRKELLKNQLKSILSFD